MGWFRIGLVSFGLLGFGWVDLRLDLFWVRQVGKDRFRGMGSGINFHYACGWLMFGLWFRISTVQTVPTVSAHPSSPS